MVFYRIYHPLALEIGSDGCRYFTSLYEQEVLYKDIETIKYIHLKNSCSIIILLKEESIYSGPNKWIFGFRGKKSMVINVSSIRILP